MSLIIQVIVSVIPPLIVGIFLAQFNNAQKERDRNMEELSQARKKENLLSLNLNFASAKLSCATAVAVKNGHANGEVNTAIEEYEKAKGEYITFLNEQAGERLVS